MGKVVGEITMSLNGYVAGPDISTEYPLGKGGERLHDWLFSKKTETDAAILNETVDTSGAVIVGARTYLVAIDEEEAWNKKSPFAAPAFVLLREVPTEQIAGFTYVTDGIESALKQAQAAAGDKNVWIMGGANTIQQYLKAGLIDELKIHVASVLFSEGTMLFNDIGPNNIELEKIAVSETPAATHFHFRVIK